LTFDLPLLRALGLRHAHGEHAYGEDAVVQVRFDLLRVDLVGQPDSVPEAAGAARLPPQRALPSPTAAVA
jgi:hypothetical protein